MGTADVIPGVSGGTIAFLLGIYEELIQSIRSFNMRFARRLLRGRFKEAFDHVGWRFLSALLTGIALAIVSLAKVITWLLATRPILVNAFFFGLIVATIFVIGRIIRKWSLGLGVALVVSAGFMYWLVGLVPVQTPETWVFLFFSGALAISAMILPGISGAFILVLLGKYRFILEAVHERNLVVILVVGLGVLCGIVTFVRVLGLLFDRYHDLTVSVLTGIVIGSLRKVWPWKETLRSIEGSHGKVIPVSQVNVWPTVWDGEVLAALVLMVIGFIVAWYLNVDPPKRIPGGDSTVSGSTSQ